MSLCMAFSSFVFFNTGDFCSFFFSFITKDAMIQFITYHIKEQALCKFVFFFFFFNISLPLLRNIVMYTILFSSHHWTMFYAIFSLFPSFCPFSSIFLIVFILVFSFLPCFTICLHPFLHNIVGFY